MGGMNYNKDIPFHAPAPAGFHDTLAEKERESHIKPVSGPISLDTLEGGKKRSVIDNLERKKDAKRLKIKQSSGEYVSQMALKALADAESRTSSRNPLSLPAPNVSDAEMQGIIKQSSLTMPNTGLSGDETPLSQRMQTPALSQRIQTPGQTPLSQRDSLGINNAPQKRNLALLFSRLPPPSNNFEIVVPDYIPSSTSTESFVPDQLDILARKQSEKEKEHALQLSLRSSVVIKDLPRPLQVRSSPFTSLANNDIDQLILTEMHILIKRDAILYPVPGQEIPQGSTQDYKVIDQHLLDQASLLLKQERGNVDFEAFISARDRILKQYMYIPADSGLGRFRLTSKMEKQEYNAVMQAKTELNRVKLAQDSHKASGIETTITTEISPLLSKAAQLKSEFDDVWNEIVHLDREIKGVGFLKEVIEDAACAERVVEAERELQALLRLEGERQAEFASLV